jgi:ABC-2 type transport system ATP-binding protein
LLASSISNRPPNCRRPKKKSIGEKCGLKVSDLRKNYSGFQLEGVGFSIPYGKVMGFLGNNGAGKSTTLKCLMGLIDFDEGEVIILDKALQKKSAVQKQDIGYVGEEPYFYDNVSVSWYGKFASQVYDPWDQNKYERLCRAYGLDPGKKNERTLPGDEG